jgi:hypothetical protein
MTSGAELRRFCSSWCGCGSGWSDRPLDLRRGLVVGSVKIMGAIAARAERLVILIFST